MVTETISVEHHPFVNICSRRFHLMLLLMFGYFSMATMTNNVGITFPCMVNSTAVALESGLNNTEVKDYGGTYKWSVATQNSIIAAASFGGLIATIPSGYLMDKRSIRHLLLISVLTLSFSSLLMPVAAEYGGARAVWLLRFIMGLGEGIMLPGLNAMVTRWIPSHEKSLGASLYTSGNQFSGIIGNPATAALCDSSLGWPSVFYVYGSLGLIWTIIWLSTVRNSPAKSKWITEQEKLYLEHYIPTAMAKEDKKIPWKEMLKSKAIWACIIGSIVTNTMLTFLLVYMPIYFKDVLQLDVKNNGIFSAVPHILNLVSKLVWGAFMDNLKRKKILSATAACRLSQLIAMLIISASFLGLAYGVNSTTPYIALSLLCVLAGGFGLCISGFLTSLLSITPNYIGVLSSISQVVGFGARWATPMIITSFKTTGTVEEWKGVLLVFVAMCLFSAVVFTLWGSGEIQSWNYSASANRTPASSFGSNSSENKVPLILENGAVEDKV